MYQQRPPQATAQSDNAPPQPQVAPARSQPAQSGSAPPANFRITDPNSDPVTSHAYPAPTEQAAPAPAPSPLPQVNNAPQPGPQAQAQPMTDQSNLDDRLAFSPDVQAGYDNPQVLFDPAKRRVRPEGVGFVAQTAAQHLLPCPPTN